MIRALFRLPSAVADYTVGTVIVLVHVTLRQGRAAPARAALGPAGS